MLVMGVICIILKKKLAAELYNQRQQKVKLFTRLHVRKIFTKNEISFTRL